MNSSSVAAITFWLLSRQLYRSAAESEAGSSMTSSLSRVRGFLALPASPIAARPSEIIIEASFVYCRHCSR